MNIDDYLRWRGDLSLLQDPFNAVDNVALSQAFYADFDALIQGKESITLKELSDLYFQNHTKKEIDSRISLIQRAPYTLYEVGNSKRFKDAVLHDFVSILNEEKAEQFACGQIDLGNGTTVVVFRGTDDTLTGWKESFKIAYEITGGQCSAENYVLSRLKPANSYIFIGHSKGGCLALYAAMKANKEIQDKISIIYSNDGPGLNYDFLDKREFEAVRDRFIKIIPKFDVVGTIFDDNEKHIVVESNVFGLAQHAGETWQVLGNSFIESKQDEFSLKIKKGFNDFMNSVTPKEREAFVNELFDALNELGIKGINEINRMSIPALLKAIKKVNEMDETTKETSEQFIKIVTNAVKQDALNTTERVKEDFIGVQGKIEKEAIKTSEFLSLKLKEARFKIQKKLQELENKK